jgi:hypothetical protein
MPRGLRPAAVRCGPTATTTLATFCRWRSWTMARYRRIKDAGKSVQAILVKPAEVVPLLDNVGPAGMYITAYCRDAAEAEALLRAVKPYRDELVSTS